MSIQWTQGQTSLVHVSFGADLTGYAVVMHVHPFLAPGEDPLEIIEVELTDAATGAGTFVPRDVAPDKYTADFDFTDSTGLLTPGQARTTLTVVAHDDTTA